MTAEAFIYDAVRIPRGKGKKTGALHSVKPISLTTGLIDEVRRRNPGLDPAQVDDIVLGVVSPVGEQGAVIARTYAGGVAGFVVRADQLADAYGERFRPPALLLERAVPAGSVRAAVGA
jgi:acetyl-CoA acetyltransferase